MPIKNRLILNIDTNIVRALEKVGYGALLPAIAKMPGITLMMVDYVADVEVCNRLKTEGGYQSTNIVTHYKTSDPVQEMIDNAIRLEPGADYPPNTDQLVVAKTKSGMDFNDAALEYQGKNSEKLHYSPVTDARADKNYGEYAILEHERNAPKGGTRIIVSNDGSGKHTPDYLDLMEKGQRVNVATLSSLVKALKPFTNRINKEMPKGSPVFSVDNVLNALEKTNYRSDAKDYQYYKHVGSVAIIEDTHPLRDTVMNMVQERQEQIEQNKVVLSSITPVAEQNKSKTPVGAGTSKGGR